MNTDAVTPLRHRMLLSAISIPVAVPADRRSPQPTIAQRLVPCPISDLRTARTGGRHGARADMRLVFITKSAHTNIVEGMTGPRGFDTAS